MNDIYQGQRRMRHEVAPQAVRGSDKVQRDIALLNRRSDEKIERRLGANRIGKHDPTALHLIPIAHKE
jgi:hypothetical protein